MENVLDNPAWNALISGNKHLSFGTEQVKYFDKEVSPFAAFIENTPEHFRKLNELLPYDRLALLVSPLVLNIPESWKTLQVIKGLQMIYQNSGEQDTVHRELIPLTVEHVPEMVQLAKLTNPGPFESGTIKFGHYFGIFENNILVAMAGQRLHVFNYGEISAVCTHPDHTGKGYARQLMIHQIKRILTDGCIPILHVKHENDRAIRMYERLGFQTRKEVYFHAIIKTKTDIETGAGR
jgi:ribosomal protein S18 acetylase RimI-like enzyme